jgi:hypothetical protein
MAARSARITTSAVATTAQFMIATANVQKAADLMILLSIMEVPLVSPTPNRSRAQASVSSRNALR